MKKPIPFGKYYLMDRVAVGGMAEVFKAKMLGAAGFERILALKRILPNIAEDQEFITMFQDEAKIAAQLQHPHIAQIYELGEEQGAYYIAMEYIQGRDLRSIYERARRRKAPPITSAMAAFILAKVCEGLHHAHTKHDSNGQPMNIVHRDVSPQNVLVSYDGDVKLIDFGVAKAQNKMSRTQAGILKGKFGYMSPEQVQGLPLDQRSDIFSLGIVLHEILTGQRLFVGESDFHTLEKIRKAEAAPPSQLNPEVPPNLDAIVMKALARDFHQRYQYASEMQQDLQRFVYMLSPVYSQQDLAGYMKHVFAQDLDKEKKRMAEYDEFFFALQQGIDPLAAPSIAEVQTPTGPSWPNGENPSAPGSFSGSHPQSPSSYSHASTATPPPSPAYAMSPAMAVPPGYGPSMTPPPQNYYQPPQNDLADSTLMDPNGMMLRSNRAPTGALVSPFSQPPPRELLSGDHFPAHRPLPISPSSAPPGVFAEEMEEEGGNDTIIELDVAPKSTKKKSSSSRGLLIGLLSALVLVLVGLLGLILLRFFSQAAPPPEPMRLALRFHEPAQDAAFFLDGNPLTDKEIEKTGPHSVTIKIFFHKGRSAQSRHKITVQKTGYQDYTNEFTGGPGDELSGSVILRRAVGELRISTEPPNASVEINGKIDPRRTPANYTLPIGPHQITIYQQGHKPIREKIEIRLGANPVKTYTLETAKASLRVVCKGGEKAKVFLNKRAKGITPFVQADLDPRYTLQLRVVPPGGFQPFTAEVSFPLDPERVIEVPCSPVAEAPKDVGQIVVASSAPAKFLLNGQDKGDCPQTLSVAPGKYQLILIHKQSNKRLLYNLDVASGQSFNVFAGAQNWGK